MATKRKRPARRNERKKRTDASKPSVHAEINFSDLAAAFGRCSPAFLRGRLPPIPAELYLRDRVDFRTYAERDWLGAFGAWLFADPNLPTR